MLLDCPLLTRHFVLCMFHITELHKQSTSQATGPERKTSLLDFFVLSAYNSLSTKAHNHNSFFKNSVDLLYSLDFVWCRYHPPEHFWPSQNLSLYISLLHQQEHFWPPSHDELSEVKMLPFQNYHHGHICLICSTVFLLFFFYCMSFSSLEIPLTAI